MPGPLRTNAGPIRPYATGSRVYQGARRAPNVGAVSNKTGYNERDLRAKAQRAALQTRLQRPGRV